MMIAHECYSIDFISSVFAVDADHSTKDNTFYLRPLIFIATTPRKVAKICIDDNRLFRAKVEAWLG
jgi:hypothetical protein